MQTVNILGIKFADINFSQAVDMLANWVRSDKARVIVTPNPEAVMLARKNADFAAALRAADLSLADGIGIIIGARILGMRLPGRVRGVDAAFALFRRLDSLGQAFSVYFLGGADGTARLAAQNMQRMFQNLVVAGTHHGFFTECDEPHIISDINSSKPDILLVCTGMPRAEIWSAKNRCLNTRLIMCLGGTIDIMSGRVRLAPGVLRKVGLEWLYRLITQPTRARRMLSLPRFLALVLRARFSQKGVT